MSDNPENKAAVQSQDVNDQAATFESKVLDIVSQLPRDGKTGKVVKDEAGRVPWPEDIGEAEKFAASQILRYRDTQSSYTKGQQTIHALEAEKAELLKRVQGDAKIDLSKEDKERLDNLMVDNPNEWRKEVNRLEAAAKAESNQRVEEALQAAGSEAVKKNELKRREGVLAEFNKEHSDYPITDDVIANDVPPRIVNKLDNGDISFEGFLSEVYTYVKKGKTVQNEKVLGQPNLSKAGGGLTPNKADTQANVRERYKTRVY